MKALPALALATLLAACSRGEQPPPAAPAVLVQPASSIDTGTSTYVGEIRARHEIDLSFRVGGKLAARLVDAGAEVSANQPLARLDPTDLQLAADAARAQLAAAESDFATARNERERYAGLLAKKFVSQTAYEARDNAFNAAQGRLEQARAQNRISGNQAAYGTLTSDRAGVITAVLAEAGQVVAAGQPVLRLARPEEKEIAIAVPEGQVAALKAAKNPAVNLWAEPKISVVGELRELSPAADPATRTYAARIRLIDPPPEVRLGMTARVSINGEGGNAIAVPLTAVVNTGSSAQVWIVRDGKAEPRAVEVARFADDKAILAKGVNEGESVVVAGTSRLVAGMAVTPQAIRPAVEQR
jgi:RND family efflux transporter MFP subunit